MKPIRILHMIGSLNIGGSQTMIINLYRAMDKRYVQFDFVLDHPEELELLSQVESMGAKVYFVPTFKGSNIGEVKTAWKALFQNNPEYKILHSHVRSYASIYLPIAKKCGLKTIIHSHNTSNGKGLNAFVKNILQYPLRYQADYFFGCSKEAIAWLFGKAIIKKKKYHILKNAIQLESFQFDLEARKEIRNKFGISEKCILVGTIGRLTAQKNPDEIIKICKQLSQSQSSNCQMKFIWVGNGELFDEIKNKLKAEDLYDFVIMTGARLDVNKILQAMDIFILPSLWEGLGIVAIEAQAAGLPTFCSDVIPREVAVSELCSFLPLGDPNIWADRILNADLTRKDCSKNIIEAGYDIKSTAQWLSEFYKKIKREI